MTLPMLGNWIVQVRSTKPFTIHGDLYYELLVFQMEEPTAPLILLRVPQHAVDGQPQPGDKLDVAFLMGQVTSAKRIAANQH